MTLPTIVCLCGSTRFRNAFEQANKDETHAGKIVLSVGCFDRKECHDDVELKTALDELHKRKIDISDEILVLNVDGYIGPSTQSEIEYAHAHSVQVRFLERVD